MKKLLLAAAIVAVASQANATTVTFASLGGLYPLDTAPPGETLYTDFLGDLLPSGASGAGSLESAGYGVECSGPNCVAAPEISTNTLDTQPFLAILPGDSETFTFASPVEDVGIYIGSLDAENSITLNFVGGGSAIYTGTALAGISNAAMPLCSGDCTIYGALTNGVWTFTDNSRNIVGITVSEGTTVLSNSFEIGEITTSVPEPSTWAMMALGFMGLGFAGYRSRKSIAA